MVSVEQLTIDRQQEQHEAKMVKFDRKVNGVPHIITKCDKYAPKLRRQDLQGRALLY